MKDLKLRDKVRTLLYMIGMVAVLFMAETTIAYATSDDDALSNSILSEQPVDENRTNIREPGSSENADCNFTVSDILYYAAYFQSDLHRCCSAF